MATKSSNSNLHRAAKVKNDEFYTQLADIEKELKHYKDQFRDKIVYCNCDDPFESNFFKYFAANFNALRLKRLITTSYTKSPIAGGQLPLFEMEGLKPDGKEPYVIEITEVLDINKDGAISIEDVETLLRRNKKSSRKLQGNGDFRSEECVELLKRADIVVTNPPFSLFRQYVAQLMEHGKKFLIIGNDNAISYKDFFEFIKKNKVWNGYGKVKEFKQPDGTLKKFGNVGWYTNLDTTKRHEKLTLYKKYNAKEYSKYDNYNAIEVPKVSDIPINHKGVMGVPVTFLDKYNPNQFEILGITDRDSKNKYRTKMYTKEDSPKYNDLNRRAAIKVNNELKPTYARLLIKFKQ
ncbi:MAG: adenine-specific methyltransferase EcoRI family protein [Patescibacteria group bacterium]|nr:adenine-specific methyltransferase EcoRI family protein [Patescibacteria group bacterium]MDD5120991.1 adenine-specific methyltransferase EcoRI family protein [Patescibacteria group bacterium]MDD5396090.1 adenine-specific methyltransferase EcoRI family protein [Patescibacteria group bacterium]